jgi:FKBP-type peptidyl-prolyl cis-trans isomerase (trigger factor)
MQVTDSTEIQDQKKRLTVVADWDEISSHYDDLIGEYSQLPIPGFRPRKAPRTMVERHFFKRICDDFSAQCVERYSHRAMKDQAVMPGSKIEILDLEVKPHSPMRFTAEFTPLPDFDLPDYANLDLQSSTDSDKRDEISTKLLEQTRSDIPDALVREEWEIDHASGTDPLPEEWIAASERVKLMMILQKIADKEGIEVDDRDVTERIEHMAVQAHTTSADLRQRLLQNSGLLRVRSFLLAEHTLDYLIEINAS